MFPQYGDTRTDSYRSSVVQQTTVLASILGRANRVVTHAIMPFTARLNVVPIPTGFILPQFTLYIGIGDLQKHLKGFLAQMTITTNDMDIYARAFPNSLTRAALDWYMELPTNSIDSYAHTADAFIAKYITSITNKQDEKALMDLQQGPHESLKDFHEQYKDELTKAVNKHIDLENLQRKEAPYGDLREKLNRRDLQGAARKSQTWDKQRDMGKILRKDPIPPLPKNRVGSLRSIWLATTHGIPLRVAISRPYTPASPQIYS
ncbi:hypothetical protein LIER_37992 [Lithospermum erythrorhizon]|uniref:Retrotransposon gag domain-containing protein n=1 Tax=Lithospermum erythrorhizon TaxID=34254 RepID=A0AAV3PUH4_LITER